MSRNTILMKAAVLLMALGLSLLTPGIASAAEAKLIKIQPVGEEKLVGFYLDPPTLQIERDTIVIWLSGVQAEDIQVIFMEGKTCKDVTANPGAFKLNDQSCYVTSFMGFGETSSLQFMESGPAHTDITLQQQLGISRRGEASLLDSNET